MTRQGYWLVSFWYQRRRATDREDGSWGKLWGVSCLYGSGWKYRTLMRPRKSSRIPIPKLAVERPASPAWGDMGRPRERTEQRSSVTPRIGAPSGSYHSLILVCRPPCPVSTHSIPERGKLGCRDIRFGINIFLLNSPYHRHVPAKKTLSFAKTSARGACALLWTLHLYPPDATSFGHFSRAPQGVLMCIDLFGAVETEKAPSPGCGRPTPPHRRAGSSARCVLPAASRLSGSSLAAPLVCGDSIFPGSHRLVGTECRHPSPLCHYDCACNGFNLSFIFPLLHLSNPQGGAMISPEALLRPSNSSSLRIPEDVIAERLFLT